MISIPRTLGCTAALAMALSPVGANAPEVKFEYSLADFGGTIPMVAVRVHADPSVLETFALDGGIVRIFNASGMQSYSFGIDPEIGDPLDLVAEPSGDILVAATTDDGFALLRFDYRGAFKSAVVPMFPDELRGFRGNQIELGPDGLLYLLHHEAYRIAAIRPDGGFVRDIDLAETLKLTPAERARMSIGGFGFDGAGNLLVTVSERFAAYVVAPDGTVRDFGTAGSAPGRFGVVGAITGDADGNIYVADKQRSVVMVFDRNFEFLTEFGGYGDEPQNLIRPQSLRLTADGHLFVGQLGRRGVSVFRLVRPSGTAQGLHEEEADR